MRKKILILTPRFPYPVIGGDRLRIYQICKILSAHFDLTLLSLCETKEEMSLRVQDDVFSAVERFYLPKWRSYLNVLISLAGRTPLQVAYYKNKKFFCRADTLLATHNCLLAHLIRVGDGVRNLQGIKFLEMTDAISLNYSRIKKSSGVKDWRGKIFALEARRLLDYERDISYKFNHCFMVSDIDRQFLYKDCSEQLKRVTVCSNGVDLSNMPFQFDEGSLDIIFIGNMHSVQNYDAALFFAKDVLPIVLQSFPSVKFRIIGRIRQEQKEYFSKIKQVVVVGEVPSVAKSASFAGLGVCSVRLGAGVQNKVLEYMALGLPVVSTSIGLEGFSAEPMRDLLVADDANEIALACIKLLKDRNLARELAVNARNFVENHHSWSAMVKPMVDIIKAEIEN